MLLKTLRGCPGALYMLYGLIPDEAEIDAISSPVVFDHFGNTGKKTFHILSRLLDTEPSKLFI